MIQVRGYVHLTRFLLQDLMPNFKKSQYQANLHQAQTVQDQLLKQAFFEIHLLLWPGKVHWCKSKKRATEPILPIHEVDEVVAEDLKENLTTLYPVRHRCQQPAHAIPQVEAPPEAELFLDNETALKHIHRCNLQVKVDLTHRTAPTRPANTSSIPQVTESLQSVNMDRHFQRLLPLSVRTFNSKQAEMCHTKRSSIKSLTSLTAKTCNLQFALDTLGKGQRKDVFFSDNYYKH